MKIIQVLSDHITEELEDACTYAKLALEVKDEYRSLSETFFALSQEEMRHHTMLHNEVVKLIADYRQKNGEPPANMLAVYDYLHKKAIEKAEEVKRYQQMYQS